MRNKFFLVLIFILIPILCLIGGRRLLFFFGYYLHTIADIEVVKTMTVSRDSVEGEDEANLETISTHELSNFSNGPDFIQEDDIGLRLLTFNIRHGVDNKGKESLDSIIQSIRETGAEIIALQEVDRFMPRSGFRDQASEIAKALGYYYVYGETINVLGAEYGNAILSAYPIIENENKKLFSKEIEKRGLLKAVINVDGVLYNIYTTHLGLNFEERIKQIEEINETIEDDSDHVALMGDFNEEVDSTQEFGGKLVDSVEQSGVEEVFTYAFYSDKPNTRIDRIYVDHGIEIDDHYVIESETSDHCMVVAVISCLNKEKQRITTFMENNKNGE